ncbi:hypothetical protein SmB9_20600 [Sphingosinicella microcystinivorans]|uniref:Uncharacterized protein n=1 Tax=Sphingosinicella microcystinivorans TaxID=335406 RepID=A0AAD1D5W0_SPHMI|nr:hypothetical protein SmB9_20600 [Sphingosinicella microcystinivorans]
MLKLSLHLPDTRGLRQAGIGGDAAGMGEHAIRLSGDRRDVRRREKATGEAYIAHGISVLPRKLPKPLADGIGGKTFRREGNAMRHEPDLEKSHNAPAMRGHRRSAGETRS